jgi:hypothetical protein
MRQTLDYRLPVRIGHESRLGATCRVLHAVPSNIIWMLFQICNLSSANFTAVATRVPVISALKPHRRLKITEQLAGLGMIQGRF